MCLQKNYLLLIWNLIWTQPPVFCLATLPGWLLKEEGWERPLWEGDIDDTPEISTSPKAETSVCVCVCVCKRKHKSYCWKIVTVRNDQESSFLPSTGNPVRPVNRQGLECPVSHVRGAHRKVRWKRTHLQRNTSTWGLENWAGESSERKGPWEVVKIVTEFLPASRKPHRA